MKTQVRRDLLIREIKNLHQQLVIKRRSSFGESRIETLLFDDILVLVPADALLSIRASLVFLCKAFKRSI